MNKTERVISKLDFWVRTLEADLRFGTGKPYTIFEAKDALSNTEYVSPCGSLEHDAPPMIYIPPGQFLKYRCPECGVEHIVLNSVDTY